MFALAIQWNDVVRTTPNQVSTRLGDEVAILELDAGMYYGLNQSGASLWAMLEAPVAVSRLHASLVAAYEVDEQRARADLLKLLEQLQAAGLIEVCGAGAR
jgi:hypothetical protein